MNKRLENMMRENSYEYGIPYDHPKSRELAELQIEDLDRKGCHCENIYCLGCETNGEKCPLIDWQKRHPEYANDELAQRIEALEKEIENENK